MPVVWTGALQGFGLGLVFMTLNVATFATLAPAYRTDATAMFALLRNIGGSFGVAMVMSFLANSMQAAHARLAEFASPYNPMLKLASVAAYWNLRSAEGTAALDREIMRQAGLLAFLSDFRLMALVCLLAMPLALLLQPSRRS